jgi:hypothetical protein
MNPRTRRERKLLPKPPEPPPGFTYFYWELVPITKVEEYAKDAMKGFDQFPRARRNKINRDGL